MVLFRDRATLRFVAGAEVPHRKGRWPNAFDGKVKNVSEGVTPPFTYVEPKEQPSSCQMFVGPVEEVSRQSLDRQDFLHIDAY